MRANMELEIYYFSGTGNSLHAARELQKRIPEARLIPITSLLDKDIIKINAEIVGVIFPVYYMTAPIVVRNFIKKLDLKSAEYIFAVATRGRSRHRAFNDINAILKKKGKVLDSFFTLSMVTNVAIREKNYNDPTKEELSKIESKIQKKLDLIKKNIANKEKYGEIDSDAIITLPYGLIRFLTFFISIIRLIKPESTEFYADSKCNGCKTCEKVCLSGKVKMVDEKPVWQKNIQCFSCYACINYCPQHSIQIRSSAFSKSYTVRNGRYFHPEVTADDIAGEKMIRRNYVRG